MNQILKTREKVLNRGSIMKRKTQKNLELIIKNHKEKLFEKRHVRRWPTMAIQNQNKSKLKSSLTAILTEGNERSSDEDLIGG